jgi:hypothetical protein
MDEIHAWHEQNFFDDVFDRVDYYFGETFRFAND